MIHEVKKFSSLRFRLSLTIGLVRETEHTRKKKEKRSHLFIYLFIYLLLFYIYFLFVDGISLNENAIIVAKWYLNERLNEMLFRSSNTIGHKRETG